MNQVAKMEGRQMQDVAPSQPRPQEKIKQAIISRKEDFEKMLPAHITFEKFQRTVMTACLANQELFNCDLPSLMLAAVKCATDGLLPDNREAAFVIFNSKERGPEGDRWVKKAQYIPMWVGLLKKIRQSEEVDSVRAHVVYKIDLEKGKFEYVLGDEERIIHEPYLGVGDKGGIIAAYCIAHLKNGDVIREVMTFEEIEKVRRKSKSGDKEGKPIGIWAEWYEEMARKTVFRRAAKWLPQSAELIDRLMQSDASLRELEDIETEYMDNNPKASPALPEGQPEQALIESQPSLEMSAAMPEGQPDLVRIAEKKSETKAKQEENKAFARIKQAIQFEDDPTNLDGIGEDFAPEFEELKKTAPKLHEEALKLLSSRKTILQHAIDSKLLQIGEK